MSRMYHIANEDLSVSISSRGAELWSIQDSSGQEFLWQGDERYWGDRAINLFPYVARLWQGKYRYQGEEYTMGIHGFASAKEFSLAAQEPQSVVLFLEEDEETLACYPFRFRLEIEYSLLGNSLCCQYRVTNRDSKEMIFGLGGHPGFLVPLDKNLLFEDYYLEFQENLSPRRIDFSQDCFRLASTSAYQFQQGNRIPLRHDLFDQDATVLQDCGHRVAIKSEKSAKKLEMEFDSPFLGIWHKPFTDAPYVCLEPWNSLPAFQGQVVDLESQEDLHKLPQGKRFSSQWKVKLS